MRIVDLRLDTCPSTFILDGLNQQIFDEFNKVDLERAGFAKGTKIDDVLVKIDNLPNVSFGPAAYPYVGGQTAKARLSAAVNSSGKTLVVNSALRTLAQQFLLWRMFNFGPPTRCGIPAVAQPGTSNHESGLALDIQDPFSWQLSLQAQGWKHLGPFDPPHYDFRGGTDLRKLNIMAFQSLWNRNNPGDKIDPDGLWGPETQTRLEISPVDGF